MKFCYLKLSRLKNVKILPVSNYSTITEMLKFKTTNINDLINPKIKKIKDKLLYSDYLEQKGLRFGHKNNIRIKKSIQYRIQKEQESVDRQAPATSIALKYLDAENSNLSLQSIDSSTDEEEEIIEKPIHMPYAFNDEYKEVCTKAFEHQSEELMPELDQKYKLLYEKYLSVLKLNRSNPNINNENEEMNLRLQLRLGDDLSQVPSSWMTDYEIYDDALQEDDEVIKYGTPNPKTEVSSIPCGGCGALLHCKDAAIPGYLPSELFVDKSESDLKSITCQRCHFMKHYNTCLDVRVSPEEYPKLLEQIKFNKKAAVILLVDLTDFPCSIWPNMSSLIGDARHVYVVGNKVDLLPRDSANFFENVKDCLRDSLAETGIVKTNIKHVGLISAKTGHGVEELINKLHNIWNYRSDIFLIGCTNSGKSTLFNILLQSDLCKSQAVDLVQRATTSQWPGTTLNLLKFPILKPSKIRLYLRTQRLKSENSQKHANEQLRQLEAREKKKIELATLHNRITHTFKTNVEFMAAINKSKDGTITFDNQKKYGLDETNSNFINSRWCYDTPGVIQPDQILHLLTTEELMKTLPNRMIPPRTFCMWSGQSIFIAGLGRLDILDASNHIRCTVFASADLPITICETKDAELIYNELLETEAFVVPINNPNRLKLWPELKSKDLETVGIGMFQSVSDIVLSNAGWIAVTAFEEHLIKLRAWTPGGRGIYLRTALLPNSVNLRGPRKCGSPAYRLGKQIYYSRNL